MAKTVSLGARISLIDKMSAGMNRVVNSLSRATQAADKMDTSAKKMGAATASAASQSSSAMNKMQSATSSASEKTKQLGEAAKQASDKVTRLEDHQKRASQAANQHRDANGRLGDSMDKYAKNADNAAQKTDHLRQKYAGLSSETSTLINNMDGASGALQATGSAVTAAGAGIAYGLGSAVKSAASFEEQMSSIKALTGATAPEMAKISSLATETGESTKFSSVEAGKGIEELLKAGVSLKDVMSGGLKGALDLAAAGELDLAESAEIASTALNAFKADNLSITQAGNILAGAANASATSVHELKYGLSAVASVASGAGMNFNDTTTALAVFAQNGLKGSDAGTSLKTMLANLTPKTEGAKSQMEQLGLLTKKGTSAFFDAHGEIKSMSEIAGLLQNGLKGLNSEQRQQALYTMFGSDAIRAGNILYKEGAAGINKMNQAMSKVTAADVAAEKMNNFNGQLKILKGSIDTTMSNIGMVFIPTLTKIVKWLGKGVDAFNKLPPSVTTTLAVIAALAGGFMLLAGPLLILIGFIPSIVAGFGAIAGALGMTGGALLSTIGTVAGAATLIIGAFVAVGIAIAQMWKKSERFRDTFTGIWSSIKNSVGKAVDEIRPYISKLSAAFDKMMSAFNGNAKGGIFESLGNLVASVAKKFQKALGPHLLSGLNASKNGAITVITFLIQTFDKITAWWTANGPMIKNAMRNVFAPIAALVTIVFRSVLGTMRTTWSIIGSVVKTAWRLISNIISTNIGIIMGFINLFSAILTGDWSKAWQSVKDIASTALGGLKKQVSIIITGVVDIVKEKVEGIRSKFENAFTTAREAVENAMSTASTSVSDFFSPLLKFIDNAQEKWETFKKAIADFKLPKFNLFGSDDTKTKTSSSKSNDGGSKFKLPKLDLSKFKLPKLEFPEFKLPKFELPKFKLPRLEFPNFKLPKFEFPKFKLPKLEFPKFKIPKFEFPKFKLPKIEFPKIKLPNFNFSGFKLPKLNISGVITPLRTVATTMIKTRSVVSSGFTAMKSRASSFFNSLNKQVDTANSKLNSFKTTVSSTTSSFQSSLSSASGAASGFFSPLISYIDTATSKFNGFKSAVANFKMPSFKMPSFSGGKADGSHATGLNRVPFDGYKAILHRGETVLTANQADIYRRYGLANPDTLRPTVNTPEDVSSVPMDSPSKPMSFGVSKSPASNKTTNHSNESKIIQYNTIKITGGELSAMSENEDRFKETAEKILEYIADKLDEAEANTPSVTREALL